MAKLGRALLSLDGHRMPVHIGTAARWMVEGLRDGLPAGELRESVTQLLDPATTDSALDQMGDLGWRLDPLLHNSVNATMVKASEKFNVIPTEIELVFDCRLLPGESRDNWLRELGSVLGPDVELSVLGEANTMPEPELGAFFASLCDVLREADPGCAPIPSLMSGGTDALHFARLGIRTYGFLPHNFSEVEAYESTMHAADERVPVSALEFGTAAIGQAVERYRG